MEILKVKLNETQTLIAFFRSETESVLREPGGTVGRKSHYYVDFKVGPDSANQFVECAPDAAMALLAMLDRQEKPPTP